MRLVLGGMAFDMLMLRESQLAIDPSAHGLVLIPTRKRKRGTFSIPARNRKRGIALF
jgi:hypothetical protein